MLGVGRRQRVYAYGAPVDLRKGFDGLSAIVEQELGRDPLAGDLYLFVSRNRCRAKVLLWDGTGLCVYAKRLERGRFACLWRAGVETPVELTASHDSSSSMRCSLSSCSSRRKAITLCRKRSSAEVASTYGTWTQVPARSQPPRDTSA